MAAPIATYTASAKISPVYGHLYPLIPLATATRVAGHDVMFGTGTRFAPKVRALNFEGYTIGLSVAEAENEARRRHDDVDQTQLLLTMFADVLSRATLADLEPLLRDRRLI